MNIIKALIGAIIGVLVSIALSITLHLSGVIDVIIPLQDLLEAKDISPNSDALKSLGLWFSLWNISTFSTNSSGGFILGSFDLSYIILTIGFLVGAVVSTFVSGDRISAIISVLFSVVIYILLSFIFTILLKSTFNPTLLGSDDAAAIDDLISVLNSLTVTIPLIGNILGLGINIVLGVVIAFVLGKGSKKKSKKRK